MERGLPHTLLIPSNKARLGKCNANSHQPKNKLLNVAHGRAMRVTLGVEANAVKGSLPHNAIADVYLFQSTDPRGTQASLPQGGGGVQDIENRVILEYNNTCKRIRLDLCTPTHQTVKMTMVIDSGCHQTLARVI